MFKAVNLIELKIEKYNVGLPKFDIELVKYLINKKTGYDKISVEIELWYKIPHLIRKNNNLYAIVVKEEDRLVLLDLLESKPLNVLGCAIDIGSTTIALYIYDFIADQIICEFSIDNPQIVYGDDILTRLHFARKHENIQILRKITIEAINSALKNFNQESIYFFSICGNTAMTHFLLGLPVNYLIMEPYVPVIQWIPVLKARCLDLRGHPSARVFIFPMVGAYFGGDLVAGIFKVGLHRRERPCFYLDVGTNAEVVLGNRDFLIACAGAAGPALEGGIFSCGTRAIPGAIEKFELSLERGEINFKTIGDLKPVGFCGSAIISLMAQAFVQGLLTPEGKYVKDKFPERIREREGGRILVLVPEDEPSAGKEIYVSEHEIKSFLRSKGAMYTILRLLCEKAGLTFSEVEKFYVAGSFGINIDVESAVILGMLPEEALERSEAVGNGAGLGALKFLREPNFEEIKEIVESITYIELNTEQRFLELLTGALILPHVDLEAFPKVKKILEARRGLCSE